MEHIVSAFTSGSADFQFANVAFHHLEMAGGLERPGQCFIDIGSMPGGKVVYTDDGLAEGKQILHQVGSNKPGDAGDDPDSGGRSQLFAKTAIRCGYHALVLKVYPP